MLLISMFHVQRKRHEFHFITNDVKKSDGKWVVELKKFHEFYLVLILKV